MHSCSVQQLHHWIGLAVTDECFDQLKSQHITFVSLCLKVICTNFVEAYTKYMACKKKSLVLWHAKPCWDMTSHHHCFSLTVLGEWKTPILWKLTCEILVYKNCPISGTSQPGVIFSPWSGLVLRCGFDMSSTVSAALQGYPTQRAGPHLASVHSTPHSHCPKNKPTHTYSAKIKSDSFI